MNTNRERFYVYELIDSRNNQPFYVGCSGDFVISKTNFYEKYSRLIKHGILNTLDDWNEIRKTRKLTRKENRIVEILEADAKVDVKIVKDSMTKEVAEALEKELISKYGRVDIEEDGILVNIKDGGNVIDMSTLMKNRYKNNKEYASKTKARSSEQFKNMWENDYKGMRKKCSDRWKDENFRRVCGANLDHSSEAQSRRSKEFHKNNPGFNKEYLIAYNKSEKGRNESRRRAEHMRNLLKTKSEDEMKIINVKRRIGKGLFSKKDHFATLKVDELSDFVITSLKFLYKNDLDYVLKLGLSKEVVDEISK